MVWACFSILILVLTIFGEKKYSPNYRWVLSRILLVVVMSIMTGFGSVVGEDHETYVSLYRETTRWDLNFNVLALFTKYSIEPGFQLLNLLGKAFHLSEPIFFFMIACLMNSLFVAVLYRYPLPELSIIAFVLSSCYFQEVNILRQSIAIAIVLFSVGSLEKKKPWSFILGLLIASTFHTSAIICLPMVLLQFVDLVKHSKTIMYAVLILWVLSILSFAGVIGIPIMGPLTNVLGDSRYKNYFEQMSDLGYGVMSLNLFYNVLMLFIIYSMRRKASVSSIWVALGCILQNFSGQFPPLIRISLFFTSLMPLSLGIFLLVKKPKGAVVSRGRFKESGKVEFYSKRAIVYSRRAILAYYMLSLVVGYIAGSPILGSDFYK